MSLKSNILSELEENRGEGISGQHLAEKYGVSRNAVWKTVKSLINEGYDIVSGRNRGYRLSPDSDRLSAEGILCRLPESRRNVDIRIYREIDSTNSEAKRLAAAGLDHTVLIAAETQTAGRGRQGKNFFSPEGVGAYMTVMLRTKMNVSDAVSVTTAASVAVMRAIKALTGVEAGIKWVNDIYVGNKKVCGILTEAITDFEAGTTQFIIIGIGVNVTTSEFPEELRETAGSLNAAGLNRNDLISRIADEVFSLCGDINDRSYIAEYRKHSIVIGKRITYYKNGEKFAAKAVDIDSSGGLVILKDDGKKETLRSGEITLRVQK